MQLRNAALQAQSQATQASLDTSEEAINKPSKQMDIYDDLVAHKSQFFSSYNPDMIEEALVAYLRAEKTEPLVSKGKYKVKFQKYGKDDFTPEANDNVEMSVRMLLVPEQELCCVEFTRLSGRHMTFLKHYEHLKA